MSKPIATHSSVPKLRVAWIDAAKTFAILCVVFGHVFRGAHDAGLIPDAGLFWKIDNFIYLFHMPLFFFLSGLTFSGQKHAWPDFLWRLGRTIVLPYVIWSAALVAIKQLGRGSVNYPTHLADLLGIAYAPISPFWFFYALFFIQLDTRINLRSENIGSNISMGCANFRAENRGNAGVQLASRFAMPRVGSRGMLVLAALAFLGPFLNLGRGAALDFALEFVLYFALGLVLQPFLYRPFRIRAAGTLAAALLFLLPPLLCMVWQVDYWTLPGRLIAVPMILAASAVFIWLGNMAIERAWLIQLTGQATLAIYCLHIFFTGTTRVVLLKLGVVDLGPQLVAGTILGLIPPIVIQCAATRIGIAGWLGFPPLVVPRRVSVPS